MDKVFWKPEFCRDARRIKQPILALGIVDSFICNDIRELDESQIDRLEGLIDGICVAISDDKQRIEIIDTVKKIIKAINKYKYIKIWIK